MVLNYFSCGFLVFLILTGGIAIFSEPAGCSFLAFWIAIEAINPPRPLTVSEPCPVSDWTFPMSSRRNTKLQVLVSQSEKASYFLNMLSKSKIA